jgi:chromosome partitioning protein
VILKAKQAKARVERIQRAHPLRWAGVVLSGFDLRMGIEVAIRQEALAEFEHEVRAEVPRRAAVQEAFQLCERLGDRPDVTSCDLAEIFRSFLFNDLLGVNGSTAVGERQA